MHSCIRNGWRRTLSCPVVQATLGMTPCVTGMLAVTRTHSMGAGETGKDKSSLPMSYHQLMISHADTDTNQRASPTRCKVAGRNPRLRHRNRIRWKASPQSLQKPQPPARSQRAASLQASLHAQVCRYPQRANAHCGHHQSDILFN